MVELASQGGDFHDIWWLMVDLWYFEAFGESHIAKATSGVANWFSFQGPTWISLLSRQFMVCFLVSSNLRTSYVFTGTITGTHKKIIARNGGLSELSGARLITIT